MSGLCRRNLPTPETIWEVSRSSAFDDPRFNPMEQEELEVLEISISLLGMMEQVKVEESFTIPGEDSARERRDLACV